MASPETTLADLLRKREDEVERRRTDPVTDLHLWTFWRKNPLGDGGTLPIDEPEWPGPLKEVMISPRWFDFVDVWRILRRTGVLEEGVRLSREDCACRHGRLQAACGDRWSYRCCYCCPWLLVAALVCVVSILVNSLIGHVSRLDQDIAVDSATLDPRTVTCWHLLILHFPPYNEVAGIAAVAFDSARVSHFLRVPPSSVLFGILVQSMSMISDSHRDLHAVHPFCIDYPIPAGSLTCGSTRSG